MIILSAILLISTLVSAQLTQNDVVQSLKIMNKERSRHKLPKVTYNYTIQKQLEAFPDNYFFNASQNMTHEFYLGDQLRVRPYNLYFLNVSTPFRHLMHDTVKTTMSSIFHHRAKQRNCFKLKKCNSDLFQMYYSCGGKPNHVKDSTPCSWTMHYYPRFIVRSLTQIGCALRDIEGANVPKHLKGIQKKVFICYGNHLNETADNPLRN